MRQPGHERTVGVIQLHIVERDPGQHRAGHASDLDLPRDDLRQRFPRDATQQSAAGASTDQGGEAAEETRHHPDQDPQQRAQRAADH